MAVDEYGSLIPNDWDYYANKIKYSDSVGVVVTHNSNAGLVLTGAVNLIATFRFISNDLDVDGYPLEDAFYSDFTSNTLSGLLATR
jgi:hypothetical protein